MTELPVGWTRGNIRRFATMKTGHTPSRSVRTYWQDGKIPWFTLADVWQLRDDRNIYLGETASTITAEGLANSSAELLPVGTVVLSRTASVGYSGVMPHPMATSQDFWNWVCGPRLLPEFLNYQLKSLRPQLRALNMGSTHQTIYQRDAAGIHLVVPPLPEQRAIADYLDRETAQIDTLINEQERLVALALERRRSTALSAAFFGVRRAPTSTNVEPWLPDTPTHWPIVQLGQVCDTQAGWAFPSDGFSETDGTRLLRGVNVKPRSLDWSDVVRWNEDLRPVPEEYHLRSDDLAFGMDRPFVGGGTRATRIDGDDLPCLLVQRVLRLRARPSCLPEYLEALVTSGPLLDYLQPLFTGVSVPHVSEWQVRKFRMPMPPLEEQTEIVQYIKAERVKIDSLISETQRLIELSRERRAALVTAAMTGQIDVGAAA